MTSAFKPKRFDWDDGNQKKNWQKHGVSSIEAEEVFFNKPLFVLEDTKHSTAEKRFYALGVTDTSRFLFIVFTMRGEKVRVKSARPMNTKEQDQYIEQSTQEVL